MINGQTHFGGYRRQRKNRHVSGGSLCRRSNQVGGTWGTNTNTGPTDVDGSKWVPGGATGVGINVRLRSVNTMSGSWRITDTPTLANEIINFVMEQHGERKSYPARVSFILFLSLCVADEKIEKELNCPGDNFLWFSCTLSGRLQKVRFNRLLEMQFLFLWPFSTMRCV